MAVQVSHRSLSMGEEAGEPLDGLRFDSSGSLLRRNRRQRPPGESREKTLSPCLSCFCSNSFSITSEISSSPSIWITRRTAAPRKVTTSILPGRRLEGSRFSGGSPDLNTSIFSGRMARRTSSLVEEPFCPTLNLTFAGVDPILSPIALEKSWRSPQSPPQSWNWDIYRCRWAFPPGGIFPFP